MKNRQIITNNDRNLANAQRDWNANADKRKSQNEAIKDAIAKGLPWEGKERLSKMTRAEALVIKAQMDRDYSVTETTQDLYISARYANICWAVRRNFKPEGMSSEQVEANNEKAEAVADAIASGKEWETKEELNEMSSSDAERKMNKMVKEYGAQVVKSSKYLTARYQRLVWAAKR